MALIDELVMGRVCAALMDAEKILIGHICLERQKTTNHRLIN